MTSEARGQLERLLGFLDQDPENAPLLRDAAQAALAADDPATAARLYGRLRDQGELTDADSNFWAIAAMRSGDPESAAQTFGGLLHQRPGDSALTFNLAWARALAKDFDGALAALDAGTVDALPQAAQLEVQLLHQAGAFEQAIDRARAHLVRHGDYPPLLAAMSVLAMDVEDETLARQCAEKAGAQPDAMTTLGLLALGDQEPSRARTLLQQSLAANAHSPRAWIGLGLAELAEGYNRQAAEHLDRGAGQFGDHLLDRRADDGRQLHAERRTFEQVLRAAQRQQIGCGEGSGDIRRVGGVGHGVHIGLWPHKTAAGSGDQRSG